MDTVLAFINDNLILIGAVLLGGFVMLLASYRTIVNMMRVLLASSGDIVSLPPEQYVQVFGKADGARVLQSPITNTPCVFWQLVVMERRSSGRSSRWITVYNNKSTSPFEVYDVTGRMKVDPGQGMELLLQDDIKKSSNLFTQLDEKTEAALTERGILTKGLLNINKTMRVHERFIEKGDEIYVFGKTSESLGIRTMDTNVPLIVSEHGKLSLINKYFWQIIWSVLIGVIMGLAVAVYFMIR